MAGVCRRRWWSAMPSGSKAVPDIGRVARIAARMARLGDERDAPEN
ncbi:MULTISPECIES: hypothetical protein [Actinoplanes]|nr:MULTISPECIES: hypothetical protein [Actinoplanes]